jgi:hypothetical protein
MEDLFLALLASILELLSEVLVQVCLEFLASLLVRAGGKVISSPAYQERSFTGFLFAVFGAAAGLVSVAIFPHPLVHPSKLHGISLLISPVITGLVMLGAGRLELRFGRKPTQIETFWIGFLFAFAIALVRFVLVK